MRGINKVILIGHLGKDPEIRRFENGIVANFSLATTEVYKDKNGNRAEKTEWHNIAIWGKQAETAEKYLKKGSAVYVEGRIRSREYTDKENIQRRAYEIICDRFSMLDRKPEGATGGGAAATTEDVTDEPLVDDLPF
jgi:single-strand DNA-binding protein